MLDNKSPMCKNGGMLSALKLATFLPILIFVLSITVSNVSAQGTINTTPPSITGTPISSTNYKAPQNANYTLQNLFHAGLCEMVGMSPVGQCIGTDSSGKVMAYDRVPGGGAMGALASLTGTMYSPPTSTAYYIANIGKDFGIAPTYAQSLTGSGYNLIVPLEGLWKVMRNFSYIIFTLVFLTVGFMIMLRKKLNPQTVITIQTALPGLVMGLFLVTFSYGISALIIDIAFLGIPLIAYLFAQSGMANIFAGNAVGPQQAQQLGELASRSNLLELFGTTAGNVPSQTGEFREAIGGLLDSGTLGTARILLAAIGALVGFLIFFGPWGAVIGAGVGALTPEAISLLIPAILIIALFVQLFRLFLKLISSYIMILLLAILSPLLIAFGSLPGRGGTITYWWKTLLAHTLIFPAVFAVFLFVGILLAPGLTINSAPPLFGGLDPRVLKFIIAYGLILGTPAVPDLVKNLMGVKDVPGIQQSASGGFIGGLAVGRAGFGRGTRRWREDADAWNQSRARNIYSGAGTKDAPALPRWLRLFGARK